MPEPQSAAIKQANTTYLSDEETGNLQITTTLRHRVTRQKIKKQRALRKDMPGVRGKQKGTCKSRKDVASEVRTKASLPRSRANRSRVLCVVPMTLWGGSDVEWEGGDGSAPRSMCCHQDCITIFKFLDSFLQ